MDIKDEIRSRLPIEQLVAQYCQLKRKGRNFVSLCPFHSDKNPSFLVSPDKGIAYCFACQSGGDIFSFIQKIENVDFPEAVKILAEKAGVEIKNDRPEKKTSVSKDEKERLRECNLAALKFYESSLKKNSFASDYLTKRGVDEALRSQFNIGYAPDSFTETYQFLLKADFTPQEIVAAGLAVQKEVDGKFYDRFRHRLMFPITDAHGVVIGFGGRTLGSDDAKYINTPESPLYHKSSVLFGLHQAKEAIRSCKQVVLVEGYFDVIAAHKAGVHNVVAVSGTALTEDHVKVLRRLADSVVLCLDQDQAGQAAASRAFELLSTAELSVLSVTLPTKDPDELVQKDAQLFKDFVLAKAVPYLETVIDALARRSDVSESSGKAIIASTLFPLFASLPSSTLLRSALEVASRKLSILESELQADFLRFRTPTKRGQLATPLTSTSMDSQYEPFDLCLALALQYPVTRSLLTELIPIDDAEKSSFLSYVKTSDASVALDQIFALDFLSEEFKNRLRVLALYAEETFHAWSDTLAARELQKMISAANKAFIVKKQKEIVLALRDARTRARPDEEAKLLLQYQQLLKLSAMAGKGSEG